LALLLIGSLAETFASGAAASVHQATSAPPPEVTQAVAFDLSPAVRDLSATASASATSASDAEEIPEPTLGSHRGDYDGEGARQDSRDNNGLAPLVTFEGVNNEANFTFYGRRFLPPDPVGAVGPNHYVEMVNVAFAVYDKEGTLLKGPLPLGSLWAGFSVPGCAGRAGDPIVIYDRRADRWIMAQFTPRSPTPIYNCVAISQTSDPTGPYFRYAFSWGSFFPDYPKYSVWNNSYLLTSRDFGPNRAYGISVASLERQKMINGDPGARMVRFFLDSAAVPLYLMGDGLLPADVDGWRQPEEGAAAPIVGTMNSTGGYGAPFDALNIFELSVDWQDTGSASFGLVTQLPVAKFTSSFPCFDPVDPLNPFVDRNCIPQPDTYHKLDVLSYRQRPTFRLAYRNFGDREAMVTNQSVQAAPGLAGVRWYEVRRRDGHYSVFQQGTYAPADGVHRWMGSIAMDKKGNIGLGYSVSNGDDVYPGIRFTGRLNGDRLGKMTLGEGVIISGSGSQLHEAGRWGDYTSMNIDPTDDCTFWYVNQYMQTTSRAGWQTRIASFRLPGCS
jgi:hypothetical protein